MVPACDAWLVTYEKLRTSVAWLKSKSLSEFMVSTAIRAKPFAWSMLQRIYVLAASAVSERCKNKRVDEHTGTV